MNKTAIRPLAECVIGGWGGQCPQLIFSKLLELSEVSGARKLVLVLQVNIDKLTKPTFADMTLLGRCKNFIATVSYSKETTLQR